MSRREEEIPPSRSLIDCLTRIDDLIEMMIRTSRRTNELLEILLGIRPIPEIIREQMIAPPAVPGIAPPITIEMLDMIEKVLRPVTDFLSDEQSAPVSPNRKEYDLSKELQRSALNGFVANSGPGNLQVKINRKEKIIRVANGEVLDFTTYFKRPLEIEFLEVKTPTSATYRILLW